MGSNAVVSLKATIVLAALLGGCSAFAPQGPTDVARGEYHAAGKPDFDRFFITLHELQVELLTAASEPQQARQGLAQAVGLTAEASDDSLSTRLLQEVKKLESQGLRVRLEVPDSPATDASATLHTSESDAASPLRTKLPEQATRLVRSRNRMQQTRAQLEKLRVTGIQLEANIEAEFRTDGPWKRDEVRRNLTDAQKLITLMQARAQEVEDLDKKLLTLVATAVTTDPDLGKAVAHVPVAPDESSKPSRRPRSSSASAVRPSAAAAARPSGAAAVKPPSDDNAGPKPVQGTAPAEIEP
jgi:hypothetical protein